MKYMRPMEIMEKVYGPELAVTFPEFRTPYFENPKTFEGEPSVLARTVMAISLATAGKEVGVNVPNEERMVQEIDCLCCLVRSLFDLKGIHKGPFTVDTADACEIVNSVLYHLPGEPNFCKVQL